MSRVKDLFIEKTEEIMENLESDKDFILLVNSIISDYDNEEEELNTEFFENIISDYNIDYAIFDHIKEVIENNKVLQCITNIFDIYKDIREDLPALVQRVYYNNL